MAKLSETILIILLSLFWIMNTGCPERSDVSSQASIEDEPIKYIGDRQPDKRFYDGALPHAVGVHHYQAFRANRSYPAEGGSSGWTYNHQPFLAYWNDTFYIQYLSDRFQEHTPPGRTLLMTSKDGREWTAPVVIFPEYELPEIKFQEFLIAEGTKAVMHQRMGFYVAPNGKLLTSAFYSFCATPRHSPNAGNGLGRVVREIRKNGSFGPVYFIRYNRHAGFDENNTNFPFYKTSQDKEFIAACEALLADKLISLQWWEEDRADDGFYVINPGDVKNAAYFSATITTSAGAGKAFNFFHKDDGSVVGIWKNQYAAISYDEGNSWSKISQNKSLLTCGAKTWAQKTEDGRYALVHNQSPTRRNRYPMTVISSDDGHLFDDMLCLRGEVPAKRYQGLHKNTGPQYYRGIIEGNGNPPGEDMWVSYSVNKEDIWIARVNTPISGTVTDPVDQDFEAVKSVDDLKLWNVYLPKWAEINIEKEIKSDNHYLELREQEPYDYAMVERIFPKSDSIEVRFRVNPQIVAQGYALQIEVQDQIGTRPMRLRLDGSWLGVDRKKVTHPPVAIQTGTWYDVAMKLNVASQTYGLSVNGKEAISDIPFAEKVNSLERIVFRTGPYRGYVPPEHVDDAMPKPAGLESEDLPGADEKAPLCVYWIDDVSIQALK
jgi:hypothetical protein